MLGVQRRHKDLVEHEKNNNNYHVLPQQQLKSWLTDELETANNHFWEINEGVKKCTKECLENWTKTDVENASGIATLLEAIKTTQNNAERGKNSRIDPDGSRPCLLQKPPQPLARCLGHLSPFSNSNLQLRFIKPAF